MKTLLIAAAIATLALIVASCGSDAEAVTLQCSDVSSLDNQDLDGDGFTPCQGDCDDADPLASPDGVEQSESDGWDQDCDNFNPTRE